jgi:hypothetical protein
MKDYYSELGIDKSASWDEISLEIDNRRNTINAAGIGKKLTKLNKAALATLDKAADILLEQDSRDEYDLLLAQSPSDLTANKAHAFNYAQHRLNDAPSWREYVDPFDVPTVEIYRQLLRQIVVLPNPEYQENILLAFLLCPTPLATMLPILLAWGEPATGKSNIGKFAARIYDCQIFGSDTTASSFRRELQPMKFSINAGIRTELPHLLVIDDLDKEMLDRNPALKRYMRSGYDRESSIVSMAKKDSDDESVSSDVFGARIWSSCYPIFLDKSMDEITRRSLIIHCKKSDESIDILETAAINWDGFSDIRAQIWEQDPETCSKYTRYKKAITSYAIRNKLKRPDKIALGKDILSSGMALGLWGTVNDALDEYGEFLDAQDLLIKGKGDIVRRTIERLLIATIEDAVEYGVKPQLQPSSLKRLLEMYISQGVFDSNLKMSNINQIVRSLGWELSDKDYIWYRI